MPTLKKVFKNSIDILLLCGIIEVKKLIFGGIMATKYPIILVHGIVLKDVKFFKAFGRIENVLKAEGHSVYTSTTDGFGSIETNAAQLKEQILEILDKEKADKVNLIAHSKGGLDSRYMIDCLGMSEHVASLTFLCTPHKGSVIAEKIDSLPKLIKGAAATYLHVCYKIFGDKNPEVLKVCRQLSSKKEDGVSLLLNGETHSNVFMQSYSTTMDKSRDDFVMGIPLIFSRYFGSGDNDGLVSVESSKFAEYKGNCTDTSVSHSEIVDFMVKKSKREKIYSFYVSLCNDLEDRGY